MRKLLVGAALAAFTVAPLQAQQAGDAITSGHGSFYVGPYAGYMNFGQLWSFPDGTEQTHENGPFYGVQAGWSFSPNISLLGNLAYSKSKLQVGNDAQGFNESDDVGIFLYDANLQFRLPFGTGGGWIAPFGQVGFGAIKYTFDSDDIQGQGETDLAFNVGLGGDFQFLERVGLRVMVKDYITSLGWDEVGSVDFLDDTEGNVAHNIGISVGLNFGF